MFAFVSAFPKSLHCTDEAQQAETVLSAVLSIYICIYITTRETAANFDDEHFRSIPFQVIYMEINKTLKVIIYNKLNNS